MYYVILFMLSNFLRFAESGWRPVTILVNRVELQTTNNKAKYYYAEGDDVDVRCFSGYLDKCEIWLDHEHAKILKGMYNVDWSYYGVGFRSFLGVTHNNMTMTCNCRYQVKVIFVLQGTFVDVIKMNGVFVRNMKDEKNSYTYYCFDSSSLQIEFDNSTNQYGDATIANTNYIVEKITTCKENTVSLRTFKGITLNLKEYPYWYDDDTPMPYLNLTANKILLNLYTINQDQFIYYGFEDGDNLTLNCSITKDNHYLYRMNSGDTTGDYHQAITIIKQLNSFDENTTLECNEYYSSKWIWYKRQIKVLFREIIPTSTAKPMVTTAKTVISTDTSTTTWPIILIVGGVLCILVSISIIILLYWKKKRKLSVQAKDSIVESYELQADTSNIEKSIDRTPSASEVSQSEDLYTEPYEFQIKTNQTVPEINYAVLDISPKEDMKKIYTETSPYAEIHHDDNKNLSSDYVNI